MKALQTQFDDKRLSNAVATPTCSSCCCCCCCLATSIASSSLLAQRIGKEGEKHQIHHRHLLTVLAALFVPIVGALVYFGFWTINTLLQTCTQHSYSSPVGGQATYTVCTNPGSSWIIPLLIIAPLLVLWFLYSQVKIAKPLGRAVLVTMLIAVAFALEFIGGAMLVITGVGAVAYLILVPVVIGGISVWYHRHLTGKADTSAAPAAPVQAGSPQPAYPAEHTTEHHDEDPTKPEEPPQQNPPASSS
jgi:hypothetical protein